MKRGRTGRVLRAVLAICMTVCMMIGLVPASELTAYAAEPAYTQVSAPESGSTYVVVAKDGSGKLYALSNTTHAGYSNQNNYSYKGLDGVEVSVSSGELTSSVSEDMLWEVEDGPDGIRLHQDEQYLRAEYENQHGEILFTTITTDSDRSSTRNQWKYTGGKLQSAKNFDSPKYLTFDASGDHSEATDKITSGKADLFTVRSKGDDILFFEASSVTPADPVPFGAVKPAKITDGQYVIVASDADGKFALGSASHSGYTNENQYSYEGLTGTKVTVSGSQIISDVYKSLIWDVTVSGSNIQLKNHEKQQSLGSSYESGKGGKIFFGTASNWSFDSNNKLISSASGKQLTYDGTSDHASEDRITSGKAGLFTVRSTGDVITFYKVNGGSVKDDPEGTPGEEPETDPSVAEYAGGPFTEVVTPEAGKSYVVVIDNVGITARSNKGYTNSDGYSYHGFDGEAVTVTNKQIAKVKEDMVWQAEKDSDGSLYLKNKKTGKYLFASYGENNSKGGYIELGSKESRAKWNYDNSAKRLSAPNAQGKYLSWDTSNNSRLFTVRSSGNQSQTVTFYTEGTPSDNEKDDGIESGDADPDATYLAFSSDVHNNTDNQSSQRLNSWINNISKKNGNVVFDTMGFCGDTASGSGNMNGDTFWNAVQKVLDVVAANEKVKGEGVFVPGNHEWQNGNVGTSTHQAAKKFKWNTAGPSANAYQIYCLGASSQSQSYSTDDIAKLRSYLESAPANKPIFVLAHFPLHDYNSRRTQNKDQMISMLNEMAKTKQIIFLWGHNHTESDTNYDKVITDKIGNTEIKFTYAAAGCMSDSEYSQGSKSVSGKGLVAKIKGTDVTLTYYKADASVVREGKAQVPSGDAPHTHSFGEWEETTAGTCTTKAVLTRKCTGCNVTETKDGELNPANHGNNGTEVVNKKAATVEEAGYTGDTKCKGCNVILEKGKEIPKLDPTNPDPGPGTDPNPGDPSCDHEYGDGVVTQTATCSQVGIITRTCKKCGAEMQLLSSKNPDNHGTYGTEVTGKKDATATEAGYTGDTVCKGCKVVLEKGKEIPKTDPSAPSEEPEKLATPEVTSVSNVVGGITIKWGAVEGAQRYRVYRRLVGEGWSKIGEVNAEDGTTFTDKTPESGKSYYYTVRCITPDGKKAVSDHTGGLKIICLKSITPSSLTNTSTGITVKWAKVAGAKGYRVYRKTGSESWKLIKEFSDGSTVSYTDTAVKSNNGTIYSYAVRATNGKTYGYYTAKKTARLTAVALSSVKCSSKKSLKVTWKENSKASGYQIQYSTSKTFASGNKSVDVSGAKTLTKTIGSLTKGKTYYVRVRAYKKSGDTKYYSAWSAKKYAKVTK